MTADDDAGDEYYWSGKGARLYTWEPLEVHLEGSSSAKSVFVYQDRVMTNVARFLRGLTDDPRCYVCGYVEESEENILRRCPATTIVWNSLG